MSEPHRGSPTVHCEGNFRIEDLRGGKTGSDWLVAHQCGPDPAPGRWSPFCFDPSFLSRACLSCGEVPSDGFQGVYWMLAS